MSNMYTYQVYSLHIDLLDAWVIKEGQTIGIYLFYFATYMHHKGQYRIRGQKKTEDDFDQEIEEQLKLSTHAKGQKRQNSAALSRKHQQSSQNSRVADSRANSRIGSSVIGSRVGRVLRNSRTDKNGVVDIEFNNVRWISIVSAYDSKRLKNVTVSKQSCESFLKRYGHGIKNDAAAMALFKDIKRHFHSWLGRINQAFTEVIDDFMRVNDRAPLQNFKKMSPVLESITKDTGMMEEKLQGCLKVYENNDFRKLFSRFQSFNQFSNKLEELIKGIYESKHRIDELFAELENTEDEKLVDKKVDKIIKKGVREAECLIDDNNSYNYSIRDRIISKVKLAINDLAERSLNLFHRVKGAKELIRRLHNLINDSRRSLQSSQIRKISKIFKAVIEEANKFEDFVANFNGEEEHVSPKLREKLNEYSESIQEQKRAVSEIQIIFVQTVIGETIETLKHNHLLNNALSPAQQKVHYNEFNHTLEEVADAMLDQTSRGPVEGLIKHGKAHFSKLEDELDKIKRALRKNEGIVLIDTENGEIEVMEFCNLADRYKSKLKNLIAKHEEALRNLGIFFKEARLPENERDSELTYLKDLKRLVEVVNSKLRNDAFTKLKGLATVPNSASVGVLATEASEAFQLMQQLNSNKKQVGQFAQNNPIKNLIKNILFENNLYLQSYFVLQAYQIVSKINEKTLIENLTKLTENNIKRQSELSTEGYRPTKEYLHLHDRLYCLGLARGVKKEMLKELDDSKLIAFPQNQYDTKKMENQIKYRTLIAETIGECGQFCKNRVKATVKVMKDMVLSYHLIEKISSNASGEFVIQVEPLSHFTSQLFRIITSREELAEKGSDCKRVIIDCMKAIKNRLSNIELADQEIDMETADAALKARKAIIQVQTINQDALKALEQLAKNSDALDIFSRFIHTVAEYVRLSKQIAYVALNEFKQPIWIGPIEQARNGMIAEIDLKGYRRGIFTDDYAKQPANVRKQEKKEAKENKSASPAKSGNKDKNIIVREHSHQKQSMDEEIAVIESENDMEEHIEFFKEADIDDIPDDMEEDIRDEMEEEINDEMEEDIIEKTGHMGEEIDQEQIEEVSHSPKKPKTEQKRAEMKPEQKAEVSVFQVIPHFKELEQIRTLFVLISCTEFEFWSSQVDYQQVEDYYHRSEDLKGRASFIKSLESCFNLFIASRFEKGLAQEVKKLEKFISLRQKFNELGQKNWSSLFSVLSSIDFSYSLLMGKAKEEIVQLKIAAKNIPSFKKDGAKLAIQSYLDRSFKSSYYLPSQFQLEDYISYCFRVEQQQRLNSSGDGFHYILKIAPQFKEALPDQETHSQMGNLESVQEAFSTQLNTGIDLQALLLHLWVKAVCAQAEDYYKPDYSVLNKYLKTLELAEKKEWIGYYVAGFRKVIVSIKEKIKAHKTLIDNTLFKVDSSNIWACIAKVSALYQPKITKQVVFANAQAQEKVLFAICEGSSIGVTHQSSLSTFLYDLFLLNGDKKAKNIINEQEILTFIGKQQQKEGRNDELQNVSNLLFILQIQHFYITAPQFIIRSSVDELVLAVISNLNIRDKQELEYQSLFHDLFQVMQQHFTNIVSLKQHISAQILTKAHIQSTNSRIAQIGKEEKQRAEAFKSSILSSDMAAMFFSALNGSTNSIVQSIQAYRVWLQSVKQEFDSQLLSKNYNLSIYIKEKNREANKIYDIITQSLLQLEPIASPPKQSSNLLKNIEEGSHFLRSIAKCATAKSIAKHCTFFSFAHSDRVLTFGLQFEKGDALKYLRSFLKEHVKDSVSKAQWSAFYSKFYSTFVEERVHVKQSNDQTEVIYEIAHISSQMRQRIRSDLVELQDMLNFTRLYNQHRFGSTPSVLKKLEEVHAKLVAKIKAKLFLVEMKAKIERSRWNGLEKLDVLAELFQCFAKELPYSKQHLSALLKETEEIGVKETDLASYIDWFMKCGVNELKMQYYILKSSRDVLITIFPVAKIEKDKSKSAEDIKKYLSEIKLPAKYSTSLEQGVPTIRLEQETINCSLVDNDHFLTQQSQLSGFEADLPEGETLLLSYYQSMTDGEKIPLYIGETQLETQCVLHIKEYETSSTVTCSIWKIAKQDYQEWKKENATPNEESWKGLRKKMRGLASSEEKLKEVCVGQSLSFCEIGSWLSEQVKQHIRRVEEKERAEQQRKRVMLTIAESEKFLEAIYHDMLKNEMLPTLKLSLKDVEVFRTQAKEEPTAVVQGYWKKIMDSNKKIIEKLEESKSSEEMNRISALIKDFLRMLKIKLLQNQHKEEQIVAAARQDYAAVEQRRKGEKEAELKRRQQEKEERRRKKLAEAEEKAKLVQEQANKQASNSLNLTPKLLNPIDVTNQPQKQIQATQKTENKAMVQSSEQEEVAEQQPLPDECELILSCEQLKTIRKGKEEQLYMSYLVHLLESQQPKDAEYFQSLLKSFWGESAESRRSLVMLQ